MRTSLNDIKNAEDFLLKKMDAQDALVYRARLILNPVMRLQVVCQQKLYAIISLNGRRELKKEVVTIQDTIFNDPGKKDLQNRIRSLFQNHKSYE